LELHTVATILAAAGQQTYAASLTAVATGLLAAYGPILLIVAAIGALTYAFWDSGESAEDYVTKQINALTDQNKAYTNSTNVLSAELQKQQASLDKYNAKVLNPNKSILSKVPKTEAQKKFAKIQEQNKSILSKVPKTEAQKKFAKIQEQNKIQQQLDRNDSLRRRDFNIRQEAKRQMSLLNMFPHKFEKQELSKIPGALELYKKGTFSFKELEEIYPNLTTLEERKQQLEIIIKDPGAQVQEAKLDGKTYGPGVPVILTSTKKPKR
jgi:uncharacterized protein YoxC